LTELKWCHLAFLTGEFYGLFSLVENVDKSFLKRRGMNQQGKAVQIEIRAVRGKGGSLAPLYTHRGHSLLISFPLSF
jgi:hypothetical protein